MNVVRVFEELVAEGAAADVTGWDFAWLRGRATEERPPWGFARLLAERLAGTRSAVDLDTGGGEIVGESAVLPPDMTVTEGWPPNAERARRRLGPRGVSVVETGPESPLPFADQRFDLVTSRHPVAPNWPEIARILKPQGVYFAQHVGPESAIELIEWFTGPQPRGLVGRHPRLESAAAEAAGLRVTGLRTARCRMEFFDVGAVVYILRKCVWWVPGFSVEGYTGELEALDARIRAEGSFTAHSTRTLIEAVKA
jgi:SAM-dependent methyltransferase